jgi:hypothetical protein
VDVFVALCFIFTLYAQTKQTIAIIVKTTRSYGSGKIFKGSKDVKLLDTKYLSPMIETISINPRYTGIHKLRFHSKLRFFTKMKAGYAVNTKSIPT